MVNEGHDPRIDGQLKHGRNQVFRNLWKLERVSLSHTNVFGDVENFAVDSARASKFSNVPLVEVITP